MGKGRGKEGRQNGKGGGRGRGRDSQAEDVEERTSRGEKVKGRSKETRQD